ncbi:MAG TPA: protein-disulfide reductase DsbD domain-containing protein [Novosphingobium sp.]|nr:protein-disulfide reductase DsbD domain-containing protein [Novosphingobium sp.]
MMSSVWSRYRGAVADLWQSARMLALALMAVLAATAAQAQPAPANHIGAELVAEKPAHAGQVVMLALHFRPAAGWHGYWLNPGDAGFGMRLDWSKPAANTIGTPQYPVPETLVVSGLMNHVYLGDYAVLVPWRLPANARAGQSLPIRVKADWLACTEQICVPEQAELATQVQVGDGPADPRFDTWRARLPAPLASDAYFALPEKGAGNTLRIAIPFPAGGKVEAPHLFLADEKVGDYAAPQQFARQGDMLIVTLRRAAGAAVPDGPIHAVLRLDRAGDGLSIVARHGLVPAGGTPIASAGADAPKLPALPLLLLAALAGGLLLNIMPCVFPILSLKALSLARAGESEADARIEGLAYSAGVILACCALGAAMLALRAGGEQVGWAFQLQEPGVVAALLLLAVAITANLLGVFELAVPGFVSHGGRRASGAGGAFATGLLAAFVATPCTGPFMASAMGAALLLPVGPAMALFAALGLGIALPFLAIAFVPALRRAMPRPGAWMAWFRRLMAVPMGLTALALAWLASRIGGWSLAGASMGFALAMLLVLAMLGRAQARGAAAGRRAAAMLATLAVLAAIALPHTVRAPDKAEAGILPTTPFSEQALAQARAQGHPVFAYFTADWCLSCKVNERVAIQREATRDAFAKAGVVVLEGDWTRRDPVLTRFLTAQGAAGVPLYMWYPAGSATPRQLPQVLSPDSLVTLAQGR